MNPKHYIYILDEDHNPQKASLMEWAEWIEDGVTDTAGGGVGNRRIDWTELRGVKRWIFGQEYNISTVFLGLDHRFGGDGPPVLFETMVFKVDRFGRVDMGGLDQRRYTTWDEAKAGHEKIVKSL